MNADLVAQHRAAMLSTSAVRRSRPPAHLPHAGLNRPPLRTSTVGPPVLSHIASAPNRTELRLSGSDGHSVQPYRSAKPRMPPILNFARFGVMGFELTSCITKTERTSRWTRTHLPVGWLRHVCR